MNKTIEDIAKGLFITICGGLLVAWIIGEGERFQSTKVENTPTAIVITTTPGYPHVIIENTLMLPVKIFIGGEYKNTISREETLVLVVESFPTDITFETQNVGVANDYMTGTFSDVEDGETIQITNAIDGNHFFYLRIDNNTGRRCDIVIDYGYKTEKRPGTLEPYAQAVHTGYHRLYSNSNVTLVCGEEMFFWGIKPDQQTTPDTILKIIAPNSGLLDLNFSQ